MKKMTILLIMLLCITAVGCDTEKNQGAGNDLIEINQEYKVYVNDRVISSHGYEEALYVNVDDLKHLDIEASVDNQRKKVILNETDSPKAISNDRPYSWYIDQGDTGEHSGNNCGPSSTVMAALWQKEDFDQTAKEARGETRSEGGWWYTDDIEAYFIDNDVSFRIDDFDGIHEIISTLQEGNIVLLCIDTTYLDFDDSKDSYIGKFYSYKGGHFLIVKGYQYIDDELYLEVYDSNGWDETYSDGSPKGKDRLYSAKDIDKSIEEWWDNYFIINNLN